MWLALASYNKTVNIWDVGSDQCIQMLNIGIILFGMSFDTTSSYLHTEISTIAVDTESDSIIIPIITDPQKPRYQGWVISSEAISSDGVLITYNSANQLRLPLEYRPSCSAVLGKSTSIGVKYRLIWIYSIKITNA